MDLMSGGESHPERGKDVAAAATMHAQPLSGQLKPIVFLKGKLVHADNVVPLIMEMRAQRFIGRPRFITTSYEDHLTLEANDALFEAMTALGDVAWLDAPKKTGPGFRGWLFSYRLARQIRNLFVLRHYLFRPVLSIEVEDGQQFAILTRLNRKLFGGRRLMMLLSNVPAEVRKEILVGVRRSLDKHVEVKISYCDAIMSSYTRDETVAQEPFRAPEVPWMTIGYTRGLPQWLQTLDRHHLRDAPQYRGPGAKPYIFFPLGVLHRKESNGKEFRFDHALEAMFGALKRLEPHCRTVFRLHPTSDVKHFSELLEKSGLEDCVVSADHPIFVIRGARAMVTYASTTLMADAWFNGCPIVEFVWPTADTHTPAGMRYYEQVVDHFVHGNVEELYQLLYGLVSGTHVVKRDGTKRKRFYPMPPLASMQKQFREMMA